MAMNSYWAKSVWLSQDLNNSALVRNARFFYHIPISKLPKWNLYYFYLEYPQLFGRQRSTKRRAFFEFLATTFQIQTSHGIKVTPTGVIRPPWISRASSWKRSRIKSALRMLKSTFFGSKCSVQTISRPALQWPFSRGRRIPAKTSINTMTNIWKS